MHGKLASQGTLTHDRYVGQASSQHEAIVCLIVMLCSSLYRQYVVKQEPYPQKQQPTLAKQARASPVALLGITACAAALQPTAAATLQAGHQITRLGRPSE